MYNQEQLANISTEPGISEAAKVLFTTDERRKLKENLISEQITQAEYLRSHPEIDHCLQRALAEVLRAQPDNPIEFLRQYLTENDLERIEQNAVTATKELHKLRQLQNEIEPLRTI